MGVDFYVCDNCGETFPDCGDYVYCEKCDNNFCDDCVNKYDIESWDDEEDEEGNEGSATNCPVCSKQTVTEKQLIDWLLKKANLTRIEVENKIKKGEN